MATKKQRVDTTNANIVKRAEYASTLDAIIAEGFCPFCEKHFFKHHRKPIIFSNKQWFVTENSWPYEGVTHHFLFVTRSHVEKAENLSPAAWTDLQKLHKKIVQRYTLKGATFMMRSGDTKFTGATVNHLHAHLVVGKARTKNTKRIEALIGFKK